MAFWALFAIMTFYDIKIKQIDVQTAIFLGIIDQQLYVSGSKHYKHQ